MSAVAHRLSAVAVGCPAAAIPTTATTTSLADWGRLSVALGNVVDRCALAPRFEGKFAPGCLPDWDPEFRVAVATFAEDDLTAVAEAFPLSEPAVQNLPEVAFREGLRGKVAEEGLLGEHAAVVVALDPAWDRCEVLTVACRLVSRGARVLLFWLPRWIAGGVAAIGRVNSICRLSHIIFGQCRVVNLRDHPPDMVERSAVVDEVLKDLQQWVSEELGPHLSLSNQPYRVHEKTSAVSLQLQEQGVPGPEDSGEDAIRRRILDRVLYTWHNPLQMRPDFLSAVEAPTPTPP